MSSIKFEKTYRKECGNYFSGRLHICMYVYVPWRVPEHHCPVEVELGTDLVERQLPQTERTKYYQFCNICNKRIYVYSFITQFLYIIYLIDRPIKTSFHRLKGKVNPFFNSLFIKQRNM